jgi:hypothetical protein
MSKRNKKILMIANIVIFIILANIKWNTKILKDSEYFDSNIQSIKTWYIEYKNPIGIDLDTIIVDQTLPYNIQNNIIMNSFDAISECSKERPIFKIVGEKNGDYIEYKKMCFSGEYPYIVYNYCYSDDEIKEINSSTHSKQRKWERKKWINIFLDRFIIFFMILQIAIILLFLTLWK